MKVKPGEALKAMGFNLNRPCRGKVLVRIGPVKTKHYAFRYRVGDGHINTRWGRLTWAERVHKDPDVWVFEY